MDQNQYNRLLDLKGKIDSNLASKEEKNEYMKILYNNGNIDRIQYEKFLNDQNSDDIIKAALTIGGFMLAIWLLNKLSEKTA